MMINIFFSLVCGVLDNVNIDVVELCSQFLLTQDLKSCLNNFRIAIVILQPTLKVPTKYNWSP